MFTKEQINVPEDFPAPDVCIENLKNNLCRLINIGIQTLNIKSLTCVNIRPTSPSWQNAGFAEFELKNGRIEKSHVDLSYRVFTNIYTSNNQLNQQCYKSAIATVWHELYHIQDGELQDTYMIVPTDDSCLKRHYYRVGIQYWGEFYANYKTFIYYEDPKKYDSLLKAYQHIKAQSLVAHGDVPREYFDDFTYWVSVVLGYMAHTDHSPVADTILTQIKTQEYILRAKELFEDILLTYPEGLDYLKLGELGKYLMRIEQHFGLQRCFKDNQIHTEYMTNPILSITSLDDN